MSEMAKAPPKTSVPSPAAGVRDTGRGESARVAAARQKAAIRATLTVVKPLCRRLELRWLVACTAAITITRPAPSQVGEREGKTEAR